MYGTYAWFCLLLCFSYVLSTGWACDICETWVSDFDGFGTEWRFFEQFACICRMHGIGQHNLLVFLIPFATWCSWLQFSFDAPLLCCSCWWYITCLWRWHLFSPSFYPLNVSLQLLLLAVPFALALQTEEYDRAPGECSSEKRNFLCLPALLRLLWFMPLVYVIQLLMSWPT